MFPVGTAVCCVLRYGHASPPVPACCFHWAARGRGGVVIKKSTQRGKPTSEHHVLTGMGTAGYQVAGSAGDAVSKADWIKPYSSRIWMLFGVWKHCRGGAAPRVAMQEELSSHCWRQQESSAAASCPKLVIAAMQRMQDSG